MFVNVTVIINQMFRIMRFRLETDKLIMCHAQAMFYFDLVVWGIYFALTIFQSNRGLEARDT